MASRVGHKITDRLTGSKILIRNSEMNGHLIRRQLKVLKQYTLNSATEAKRFQPSQVKVGVRYSSEEMRIAASSRHLSLKGGG